METKTLSEKAMQTIDSYLNLPIGPGVNCPYYNNRRSNVRAGLRAVVGKGSIDDIADEIEIISLRERIPTDLLSRESFKQFLVNHNIGIDCSGFAFHVLNDESLVRTKKSLRHALAFSGNPLRKILSHLRPAENAGVQVFLDSKNSKEVPVAETKPGDIIVMSHQKENRSFDHILVVSRVDYTNEKPTEIQYTHSIAWPTDGKFGHGVRHGIISITDPDKSIAEQNWTEAEKTGEDNYTLQRAKKADYTALKRLNWF